jgi:hypothetical protein
VSDACDTEKLSAFRDELGYKAALFLRLQCRAENAALSNSRRI